MIRQCVPVWNLACEFYSVFIVNIVDCRGGMTTLYNVVIWKAEVI
jgi:hypothetical protein